jgi:hypothetical protein
MHTLIRALETDIKLLPAGVLVVCLIDAMC